MGGVYHWSAVVYYPHVESFSMHHCDFAPFVFRVSFASSRTSKKYQTMGKVEACLCGGTQADVGTCAFRSRHYRSWQLLTSASTYHLHHNACHLIQLKTQKRAGLISFYEYCGNGELPSKYTTYTIYFRCAVHALQITTSASITTMLLPAKLDISEHSRKFYDGTYTYTCDGFTNEEGGRRAGDVQ